MIKVGFMGKSWMKLNRRVIKLNDYSKTFYLFFMIQSFGDRWKLMVIFIFNFIIEMLWIFRGKVKTYECNDN